MIAAVRAKLATDYGIRDIPHELLVWMIQRHYFCRAECDAATCAFLVANEWHAA